METKQILFEVGDDVVQFYHRNMVWQFRRPNNEVWDRFERLKNSTVTIKTKTVESELDDFDSKKFLFQELFLAVCRPNAIDNEPVINRNTDGWEKQIDFKYQKELASFFGEVNVKKNPEEEISFGATSKDVVLEALHYWKNTTELPNGEMHIEHKQKRLQLVHTFRTPNAEEEREYRKLSQGKTMIERGSRESRKIVRNDLAGYRRLYEKLIESASGYGVNGDAVFNSDLVDSIHKMVAVDGLFAEEGADETKN